MERVYHYIVSTRINYVTAQHCNNLKMAEEQKEEEEVAIHGDVLETILSYVPLTHLLPACFVSKTWNAAVSSSLSRFNKPKPWLLVHTQSIRRPHATAFFAYDPRSDIWLQINKKQPPQHVSPLRSSNSTLLHVLHPSNFSFSIDPFHLTWHRVNPPAVWRLDPIVAMVGPRIVVAGGACDFEDDPLAVEIYDISTRTWERTESMPATLKDSASSTWLSIAANTRTVFMMEQASGVTHSFNPDSKTWYGPFDLRPDRSIYFSVITCVGDNLIMLGLLGDAEDVNYVKLWELNGESLEFGKEIGVMPTELVEKLKGEGTSLNSIRVSCMGGFFYIYNPGEPGELVALEVGEEGWCRWGSLKNAAVSDRSRVAERVVLTCSDVGLGEIAKLVGSGNGIFTLLKR
ncbi:hypothetical protein ERO13_D01G149900v2 [Gossypium hirsutum]|uniref:F-box/kelch-repeat protein At1g23390 n=2 Tax=Gossypium TaxID=3633 RepID=A0A1U8L034_GOSHI|nr:F-box/kelch-repeat protein At1g23390 [Gossypium hirsutum]KAG4163091.1 hypothetical protein ERO13_D01G149900v2 [Gossypium hirsutum]TYH88574.1 hypothetical protein ES332_D01G196200v1 [Gossypium tomentosum]